jgi:ADP-ribosylglycohydrolase
MMSQDDFEKGIEVAIRAGFDTDTVAAIAGSLLGPLTGVQFLPEEWLEKLHGWPEFDLEQLVILTMEVIQIG